MICQACGVEQVTEARFCEDCGSPLQANASGIAVSHPRSGQTTTLTASDATTCTLCGYGPGAFGPDGYCTRCGLERVDHSRDHLEVVVSPRLAGVSDLGMKHFRNEDALALASETDAEILIVCDGVSNSQSPDMASTTAANAALQAICNVTACRSTSATHDLVTAALQAARDAVRALPVAGSSAADPPETTIVVAVRRGQRVSLGWVGDSRAYLVDAESARQCTVDHSWLNEVVDAGIISLAEALRSPLSHALTRSLGGPAGSSEEPSQVDFELPPGPSYLLLCSDGLWNYLPDADSLAVLIRGQAAEVDALGRARTLLKFALERGGHDNITVAVLLCQDRSQPPLAVGDSQVIELGKRLTEGSS